MLSYSQSCFVIRLGGDFIHQLAEITLSFSSITTTARAARPFSGHQQLPHRRLAGIQRYGKWRGDNVVQTFCAAETRLGERQMAEIHSTTVLSISVASWLNLLLMRRKHRYQYSGKCSALCVTRKLTEGDVRQIFCHESKSLALLPACGMELATVTGLPWK